MKQKVFAIVLLVLFIAGACNSNDLSPVLVAHTATRRALDITATYLAPFPTPLPSVTYFGECFLGVSGVCTAEAPRLFAGTATWFAIRGTYAMETLTPDQWSKGRPWLKQGEKQDYYGESSGSSRRGQSGIAVAIEPDQSR
jgi:hypothetical protein